MIEGTPSTAPTTTAPTTAAPQNTTTAPTTAAAQNTTAVPNTAAPTATVPPQPAAELSERDEAVLAFERQWWRHVGAKEEAIRATFGLSAARYYQLLGALVDSPLALAFDPMLVKRLQRMRSVRSEARASRSLPTHD